MHVFIFIYLENKCAIPICIQNNFASVYVQSVETPFKNISGFVCVCRESVCLWRVAQNLMF